METTKRLDLELPKQDFRYSIFFQFQGLRNLSTFLILVTILELEFLRMSEWLAFGYKNYFLIFPKKLRHVCYLVVNLTKT